MGASNVVFLANAALARESAEEARQLARRVPDAATVGRLLEYAAQLDARFGEYERLAVALGDTVTSIKRNSTELAALLKEVRQRLQKLRQSPLD